MNELDDQLRSALKEDRDLEQGLDSGKDRELLNEEDDFRSHMESLKRMFRGNLKWISIFHFCLMGILLTLIVVSAFQFYYAETVKSMIGWAAALIVFCLAEAVIELIFFMEWDKYVVRREIKQVELQVALLCEEVRASLKNTS